MRHDVSPELLNKLNAGKVAKLLDIPEYRITGALERRILQYIYSPRELFRFDKPVSSVEAGTSVFVEPFDIVRGFPKISRVLVLYPGLVKHFSSCKKVVAEEKMNGYNTRIALIGDTLVALTRGGFVCPYTTEKANKLVGKEFFHDHPGLILCGEMVGPDSPYVPKSIYDIESLEFFVFDIREKVSGKPMPVMERRALVEEYGLNSVRLFGEYDVDEVHIEVTKIIKGFGSALNEGVVIKDPQMVLPAVKYTSSLSNCADLEYAFEFYNDYGRDFFFPRVCREAFQSVEWDEDEESRKKRCQRLGESILQPMIRTIKRKQEGERIAEAVQIRVMDLRTVDEFEEYLRLLGVDAIFEEPEPVDDEYIVKIRKIFKSTNDKTDSILRGELWS